MVVLVELKNNGTEISKIDGKFKNSAKNMENMVNNMITVCNGINISKIKFFPVLLSRSVSSIDRKALANIKVKFFRNKETIICKNCGSDLANILEEFT